MSWLSKIDPNTVIGLIGLLGTVATWAWSKLHGNKVASFTDVITGLGKQAIHTLMLDPTVIAATDTKELAARAASVLTGLARSIGIPSNAITDALIQATAQHVVGDVLAELRAAAGLQDQLDKLNDQVSGFPATLAKIEADALARGKVFADQYVERVDVSTPTVK